MARHKVHCSEAENIIDEALDYNWDFKHVIPVYHKEYRRYELNKDSATRQKPTSITIKRNGAVMITIDRRSKVPYITVKQRKLSRSSAFPNHIRIELGFKDIAPFFKELKENNLDLRTL